MMNKIKLLDAMVNAVTDNNGGILAWEEDNMLFLVNNNLRATTDMETLEDSLYKMINYLRLRFNVDFEVEYAEGNVLALTPIAY